ncbi:MAG: hypothetical protein ACFCVE_06610 [Phycisphaerae bacterium]
MPRGLSERQRTIIALFDGSRRRLVYGEGPLTTSELMEELVEAGDLPKGIRRDIARFTIRRACRSLERRGHLASKPVIVDDTGGTAIEWRASK